MGVQRSRQYKKTWTYTIQPNMVLDLAPGTPSRLRGFLSPGPGPSPARGALEWRPTRRTFAVSGAASGAPTAAITN